MTRELAYESLPTTKVMDELGIPWMILPNYQGPQVFNGAIMYPGEVKGGEITTDRYGDVGLWHELCHYLVASPKQRNLPDYGLGVNANADIRTPFSGNLGGVQVENEEHSWGDEWRPAKRTSKAQEAFACCAIAVYDLYVTGGPLSDLAVTTYGDFGGRSPDHPSRWADKLSTILAPVKKISPEGIREWLADQGWSDR